MKLPSEKLLTPFHLKTASDVPWPADEKLFYLLTANGLFRCRNHPFFRSSVPVNDWPAELAAHRPFLKLSYPKIPQRLFERVIGFFARIGDDHGAEAAVLLAWHKTAHRLEVIVPEQCTLVGTTWSGRPFPVEVRYEIPPLPPDLMLIGDIHSHVDMPAYASAMDKDDELHRPGLHIVVGRLSLEPPELHIEVTVDGTRFQVHDPKLVLAGYHHRRPHEVPQEWIAKVKVESYASYGQTSDLPLRVSNDRVEVVPQIIGKNGDASPSDPANPAKVGTPSSEPSGSAAQPSPQISGPTPQNNGHGDGSPPQICAPGLLPSRSQCESDKEACSGDSSHHGKFPPHGVKKEDRS
ncbi:MAG: Mov34/MPN/PAD-1 family protein [Verrucomicrobia bacterium]|nr:Mov34/MPN/PAD-1 family protein [Verrucomicrobiota bacterium]